MEKVVKIQIEYIERSITELRDHISKFTQGQEKQMENLANSISLKEGMYENIFMRREVMEVNMQKINTSINSLRDEMKVNNKNMDEIKDFLPMLKDIKKERENIKFRLYSVAQQLAFWIVLSVLALNTIFKK